MSADADVDGTDGFAPETVTTAAEVAEATRSRHADAIYAIMAETDCVALKVTSSWHGNEAFGFWSEWFFVHTDSVSPSGKALFVREGVTLSDAVGKYNAADSISRKRDEGTTGYTSGAVRNFRRKAFNWTDNSAKPGPGTLPTDDRESFTGESTPLSWVEAAIRTPADADNVVFPEYPDEGYDPRCDWCHTEGTMDEADITVSEIVDTKYGEKVVMHGDTYDAFKTDGVEDEITFHANSKPRYECAHHTFNGDAWVADRNAFYWTVVPALLEAGYSVAVDPDVHSACLSSWNAALTEHESN